MPANDGEACQRSGSPWAIILVNVARGEWAHVLRGRLRGAVEAARSSHRLDGEIDSGGGATLAFATPILGHQ